MYASHIGKSRSPFQLRHLDSRSPSCRDVTNGCGSIHDATCRLDHRWCHQEDKRAQANPDGADCSLNIIRLTSRSLIPILILSTPFHHSYFFPLCSSCDFQHRTWQNSSLFRQLEPIRYGTRKAAKVAGTEKAKWGPWGEGRRHGSGDGSSVAQSLACEDGSHDGSKSGVGSSKTSEPASAPW